jgi:ATP-dependent DNA helicase DinG
MSEWEKYFPYTETCKEPRPEQVRILDRIEGAFTEGVKDVIVEAATGIGKSAIAVTVSRMQKNDSYITVTDISLENQYMRDFKQWLQQLHSSANYQDCPICRNCSIGNIGKIGSKKCDLANAIIKNVREAAEIPCHYQRARWSFMEGKIGLANISFMANWMKGGSRKRELAIFDEAHKIGDAIGNQYSISLKLDEYGMPPNKKSMYIEWCKDNIRMLTTRAKDLAANLELPLHPDELLERWKKELRLVNQQVETFTSIVRTGIDAWVLELEPNAQKPKVLTAKPKWPFVVSKNFFNRIASKRLYLSGTLPGIERQLKWLGIEKATYIGVDSPFKAKNRMIYLMSCITWNYRKDKFQSTYKELPRVINKILAGFPKYSGLVHCTSYKTVKAIINGCANDRLFTHGQGIAAKAQALHRLYTVRGVVLVSPTCHEGMDLYDDRARFQIIVKIPYPSFKEKLVRERAESDREWVKIKTSQTLQQMCGRATRHSEDWSITFIIDSKAKWFITNNKKYFPLWQLDAIEELELD